MAILNYAAKYSSDFLEKLNGELIFTGDGHIITHGVDYYNKILEGINTAILSGLVFLSGASGYFEYKKVGDNDFTQVSIGIPPEAIKALQDGDGKIIKDTYLKIANILNTDPTTASTTNTKVYSTTAVDTLISNRLSSALQYKGTYGPGGTLETLPTTGTKYSNGEDVKKGDTFKALANSLLNGSALEVGDTIICESIGTTITWNIIQANIDFKAININGGNYSLAIVGDNIPTSLYAPTSLGEENLILTVISKDNVLKLDWIDPASIKAGSVKEALTIGGGLTSTGGTTYDGSAAVTVSLLLLGEAKTAVGQSGNVTIRGNEGKIHVPYLSIDEYGRVTELKHSDVTITDTTYSLMSGAANDATGVLVPNPSSDTSENSYLSAGGRWESLPKSWNKILAEDTSCSANLVDDTLNIVGEKGLSILASTNDTLTVSLKLGTDTSLDSTSAKTYGIGTDANGKLFVNVPWENSTYSLVTASEDGLVPKYGTSITNIVEGDSVLSVHDGTLGWHTLPSEAFTNTWRPIKLGEASFLADNATALGFTSEKGITITSDKLGVLKFAGRDIKIGTQSIGDDILEFDPDSESGIAIVEDTKDDGVTKVSFRLKWYNLDSKGWED